MKTRRHRRTHHDFLRKLLIWMGLIITPFLMLLLWDEMANITESFQSRKKVGKQMINLAATQEPLYVEDVNRTTYNMEPLIKGQKEGEFSHRVYPYSVVNRGVHSVQELRSAIERDPVVAKHYSNFKLDRARVIEAKADGDFHVSYRIGEEIFWTKKRLKVAKGERLITDGTNFTRTRCANVLSEAPPGKTSPDEPTPEVFDTPTPPSDPTPFTPPVTMGGGPPAPALPPSDRTPVLPPVVIGEGPPASMPPPWEPAPFIPPVVTGGGPTAPTLSPSEPTPFISPVVIAGGPPSPADRSRDRDGDSGGNSSAPVPEPTTLLLLGSGLIGLAGYGGKRLFKR